MTEEGVFGQELPMFLYFERKPLDSGSRIYVDPENTCTKNMLKPISLSVYNDYLEFE